MTTLGRNVTTNFKIKRDVQLDSSRLNSQTVNFLKSAGTRPPTGLSPNPKTILVNSPLECEGGLIMPNSGPTNLATEVINDDLSGKTIIINPVTTRVVLDSNLSSGCFGEIVFQANNTNSTVIFDAGENNVTTDMRYLKGYFMNNGVYTSVYTNTENLEMVTDSSDKTASTIIKWKKLSNEAILFEGISLFDNVFQLILK